MLDHKRIKEKLINLYYYNIKTGNDCLLEPVETVEEARSFFYTYGSNLEQGCETVRTEIKSRKDHFLFWDWLFLLILAVLVYALGTSLSIITVIVVFAAGRFAHTLFSYFFSLTACKKASREAGKIKNKIMLSGMSNEEILRYTKSFIDIHNMVWETQEVKRELQKNNH